MSGYNFNWVKDDKEDMGVVAQEVEAVCPRMVHSDATPEAHKSVEYNKLPALLIEAVKELSVKVDELRADVNALK